MKFKPGDKVVFNDQAKSFGLYVDGVKTVEMVENIHPDKCTCGGYFTDSWHEYGCLYKDITYNHGSGEYKPYGKRVIDSVGHSQFVTVNGKLYSGIYFTLAESE